MNWQLKRKIKMERQCKDILHMVIKYSCLTTTTAISMQKTTILFGDSKGVLKASCSESFPIFPFKCHICWITYHICWMSTFGGKY